MKKRDYFDLLAVGSFSIVICFIYSPSLFHIARADQIAYLAEMGGREGWVSIFDSYSFARERHFVIGDQILFRPLLYVMLGLERWLFGYNFPAWQSMGPLLHLGVVVLMFRFLRRLGLRLGAWGWVVLFATLVPAMELVSWQHLHAYLVFAGVMLAFFHSMLTYLTSEKGRLRGLLQMVSLLTVACFTYEMGVVWGFVVVLFFVRGLRRMDGWWLSVPVLLYLVVSGFDYGRSTLPSAGPAHFFESTVPGYGACFIKTGVWLFYMGLFPGLGSFYLDALGRTGFFPSHWGIVAGAPLACSILVLLLLVWAWGWIRSQKRGLSFQLSGLFLSFLVSYVAVLVVGRMSIRGLDYLFKNIYYTYFFWMFGILFIGAWMASLKREGRDVFGRFRVLLAGIGCCFACYHGFQVWDMNQKLAEKSETIRVVIIETNELIARNGRRPDFSFFAPVSKWENPEIEWLSNGAKRFTLLEALYPKWFRVEDPLYVRVDGKWERKRP